MKLPQALAVAVAFLLILVEDARAYLDPGTGSFIFQTLVAMMVGAAFTVKMYWQRLKGIFGRKSATSADVVSEPEKDAGDPT
jgi:hypothetical protein